MSQCSYCQAEFLKVVVLLIVVYHLMNGWNSCLASQEIAMEGICCAYQGSSQIA